VDDPSVMVIQWCGTITECQGADPMLLGLSSVRLKPIPDRLRFSAAMTLHRLNGPAQVIICRANQVSTTLSQVVGDFAARTPSDEYGRPQT